jgi:hypothetical protein
MSTKTRNIIIGATIVTILGGAAYAAYALILHEGAYPNEDGD